MSIYNTIQLLRKTPLFKENLWEIAISTPDVEKQFPDAYLFAQNVTFPPTVTFTTDRNQARKKEYYTEYQDPNTLSINFIETEDLKVSSWIDSWINYYFQNGTHVVGKDPRVSILMRFQKFGLAALGINLAQIGLGGAAGALGVGSVVGAAGALASGVIPPSISSQLEGLEDTKTYSFNGCRFKDRSEWTMSYESSELNIITVNFSVEELL